MNKKNPPVMGLVQSINGREPASQRTRTSQNPDYPTERLAGLALSPTAGPPLADDETSLLVRVRLPMDVAAWWTTLTAMERGAIITAIFVEAQKGME